ncbi:MAG TPA: glycosyltransferase family 1 protein [Solirubrobacteraceae bacterium]
MGNPDLSPGARSVGPILLNRRAATRPTVTGVERWTGEIIPRLHALAPERYQIVQPRPRLRRRGRAQAWEQVLLPAMAARRRAAVVFSPANLAPLAWPRNVLVVHDAAVLRERRAYSSGYRAWHRLVGLTAARRALHVITVSEFSRRELIALAGLAPERLTVVPGGVSPAFAPQPEAEITRVRTRHGLNDRPYVLTLATEDRRKNLASLGQCALALRERGIELVRAGDVRPYFAGDPSARAIRSLGYVADRDLPALYAGAQAFVLPSRYEGFGLTCLEAMATGTPVVAAQRAALPETCGDAALLVDPDDQAAVARAVTAVATEDALRRRLIEAGRRRAARFTWDRAAAATHGLLLSVAGN